MKHVIITQAPNGTKHQLVKDSHGHGCTICSLRDFCNLEYGLDFFCYEVSGKFNMHYEKIS